MTDCTDGWQNLYSKDLSHRWKLLVNQRGQAYKRVYLRFYYSDGGPSKLGIGLLPNQFLWLCEMTSGYKNDLHVILHQGRWLVFKEDGDQGFLNGCVVPPEVISLLPQFKDNVMKYFQ